ncbi:9293_t:CDS:1 [Dentiscutata erythropus]|uniref:9293_t:CDS:1 n=1 Tax=Dentiscutata erythropus TaxID=1348616 RepID=A0A9N9JQS9_9GLOM|nr:9293_t:CDS:1 [Dentiscutata erythropus]
MDKLIIFNNISKINKEKLSLITENDGKYAWYYITLFYNDKPCSLDGFKLYDDNSYEYSRIKNDNRTEFFLFKTKSNLYFKDDLIYKICYNEYKLTNFHKNGKICIYLTLNNHILNLSDFKCKFINKEAYTINIDKNTLDSVLFNDNKVEEIEVENDDVRDYYKLKNEIGHYFILYKNSVIKHISTYNYFDYYDVEEYNISEKIFIKSV